MPRRIYSFDPPDHFVAGAVGQPGQRTFFLQAAKGSQVVSVTLEKAQVAVLAERLATLLLALRQRGVEVGDERFSATPELAEPVVEEFRVGTLTLGWDPERERVVIEAREMGDDEMIGDDDEDEETAGEEAELDLSDADQLRAAIAGLAEADAAEGAESLDVVRVELDPNSALQFASGAIAVVQAGRPPCPMCGEPLEPTGHFCLRRNGLQN